jgi:hypothetical protein
VADCVGGADAGKFSDEERARWRRQAREWLSVDLADRTKKLAGGTPADRKLVQQQLPQWKADFDLAGLHEPGALRSLPAEEQDACRGLWKQVGYLLRQTNPP